MKFLLLFNLLLNVICTGKATTVIVETTSGLLHGTESAGVKSFKAIRYGQAPEGLLRWEPPLPFLSIKSQNNTVLGPSCVQQFAFATSALTMLLFNTPPPPAESEDCLFLNVWAPSSTTNDGKAVVVWIHGGSLAFGTASLAAYDGTSLAANQDIVVVTINYRTNVFGFPSAPDLNIKGNNLGFFDQELALQWVQANIKQFGGDPTKVTIMGQSAGSQSVGLALARHPQNPPFRAGIMLSGAPVSSSPIPSFASFNSFASSVNCNQTPGLARLQCLKQVPASVIRNFTNGPISGNFGPVVDNITVFTNPLERIRANKTARVPFIIGNMQDDGSLFTLGDNDLAAFLDSEFPGIPIPPDFVRSLYPGLNDTLVISASLRDLVFLCPAELWTAAAVGSGIKSVFRYTYGAVFADLQKFPGAGAWHSSELGELFGTFNRTTATVPEATLSNTFQTAFANFIKDPNASPAPNWPEYVPGSTADTLAKLAYVGNVDPDNFVQPVQSNSLDGPCDALWDQFLDFTS